VEIINAVKAGANDEDLAEVESASVISTYSNSPAFTDLCRGPHVPRPRARTLQVDSRRGAYWRGDEKRPQLQRIYGTAWRLTRLSKPTSPN